MGKTERRVLGQLFEDYMIRASRTSEFWAGVAVGVTYCALAFLLWKGLR